LELISGEREWIYGNRENGALFHLAMIAVKHLEYEVEGGAERKIIGIEVSKRAQLYSKKRGVSSIRRFGKYIERRVDIVLAGPDGSDLPTSDDVLVEVKSLKSPPVLSRWSPWSMQRSSKASAYHRQYFLDRVLSANNFLPGFIEGDRGASNFQWWLQSFHRTTETHSYSAAELTQVRKELQKLPKGSSNGSHYVSVGLAAAAENNATHPLTLVATRVLDFNLKNWFLVTAKDELLGGIGEELIQELISNSAEF